MTPVKYLATFLMLTVLETALPLGAQSFAGELVGPPSALKPDEIPSLLPIPVVRAVNAVGAGGAAQPAKSEGGSSSSGYSSPSSTSSSSNSSSSQTHESSQESSKDGQNSAVAGDAESLQAAESKAEKNSPEEAPTPAEEKSQDGSSAVSVADHGSSCPCSVKEEAEGKASCLCKKRETSAEVSSSQTSQNVALEAARPAEGLGVGASLATGLPGLWTASLELMAGQHLGLSFAYGGGVTKELDGWKISSSHQDLVLRFLPGESPFFVGLGYGRQELTFYNRASVPSSGGASSSQVNFSDRLESHYLSPQMGWFWRLPSGLLLGFDFGYQANLAGASGTVTAQQGGQPVSSAEQNSASYQKKEHPLEREAAAARKNGLPFVEILRLGWMY